MSFVKGYVLPGLPHLLLTPQANEGWSKLHSAFEKVREEIAELKPDLILLYSTYWFSVIGHQVQAAPQPEWVHVDEEFHALGSIPYKLNIDAAYAEAYVDAAKEHKLAARTVNYKGFPIDTGSIVVAKLINPENRVPMTMVSSNVYSDQKEQMELGRAAVDALKAQGKKAVAVVVTPLSSRMHTTEIDPRKDKIASQEDQDWNMKLLERLAGGRLGNLDDLAKPGANLKPYWWLNAALGERPTIGDIKEYQPVYGSGAAIVGLTPAE